MQHATQVLIFRFAVIALSLGTWAFMLIERSTSEAMQSALVMLLGMAAGYHVNPIVHQNDATNKENSDES